ncbi:hypothetical protein LZD49_33975 [Dyadobacter sp. CY261]|uniref:SprT-like domain-containing protein n=1 Tax=Dyadobacter sp. CY261 TaxID=2907203 RepID=UPI001F25C251|nr:SprT-like domain-containing protein [Dyadobacter sp. CY261]MCF0075533.1 hypothetical protein [Dyadobacter sp. CY261]
MKKSLVFGVLACFVCLFVYSCVEKDSFLSDFDQSDSELLEKAKAFYEDRFQAKNLRENEDNKKRKKLEPSWDASHKSKLENGETILIVETAQFEINVDETEFYRCYVFKEKNGKIVDARIMEFIGDANFLSDGKHEAVTKSRSTRMKNYTGLVISYDLDYQYLEGYSYKNGEREETGVRLWVYTKKGEKTATGRVASTLRTQVEEEYCEKIYWCYVWTNGAITNCVYTGNCEVNYNPNTPPPSGSSPTQTTTTPPNGSIKNDLKTPCLKNTFNNTVNLNLNNVVQGILGNFNKSQALGFTIKEQSMQTTPGDNAYASGNHEITMNSYALANASREYVAATIYHEIIHLYLTDSEMNEHATMAAAYIQPMKLALMAQFPSLGETNAYYLAWGGLEGKGAWNVLSQNEKNNIINTNIYFKNLNNQYNHQYGSACN